tara:strand:- start:1121 stop:1477 length:357 start_codon:yes stop_codon:yes gene_type:complete
MSKTATTKQQPPPEGFETVEPLIWKPQNPGEQIEGKFLFSDTKGSKFGNPKLFIQDNTGQNYLIFAPKMLEDRMRFIEPGSGVLVRYEGLSSDPVKAGQAPMKEFSVYRAKENTDIPE